MKVEMGVKEDKTDTLIDEIKTAIQYAMIRIGMAAQKYATNSAPRDTGHLAQSICYVTKEQEGTTFAKDSTPERKIPERVAAQEEKCVYIGTNVYYAPYQEYGTRSASGGGIAAKHFIKNSVQDHKEEYRKILDEEIGINCAEFDKK